MADLPHAATVTPEERGARRLEALADWFTDCKNLLLESFPSGLIFDLRAGASALRELAKAEAEHQRLNAQLKHANSMQEWPSGILALVGKAIDPSGNTHPNDYAPSIKSLKAEHQRLREYDEAVAETLKPNDGYNCEYVSIPVTAWMKVLAAHHKIGVPRG